MFFPQAVFRGPLADQQRSPRGGGGGGARRGGLVLVQYLGIDESLRV